MIIDFFAGVIAAILSGMGVGGGGLLVLYLAMVKNMGQTEAQGINLLFFIVSAVCSIIFNRKKRKVDYDLCGRLILYGSFGALVGAYFASVVSPDVVRKAFGWLLCLGGVYTFFTNNEKKKSEK